MRVVNVEMTRTMISERGDCRVMVSINLERRSKRSL